MSLHSLRDFFLDYKRQLLVVLTAALLVGDTIHSFRQHSMMGMDGDMMFNVVLSEDVSKVLSDPLAFGVLLRDDQYLNPNRFVAHWANYNYCWNVPLLLQRFTDPINSIYVSQAIFKTGLQLILIFLLAAFISPERKFWKAEFLLPALLVTPFFQTFGFNTQMGIIDKSMTYDFFYAFPILFVLLFFLPLYRAARQGTTPKWVSFIFLLPCAFLVAFSGPLNLGVAPVICLAFVMFVGWKLFQRRNNEGRRNDEMDWKSITSVVILGVFCLYSLYINMKAGTMAEAMPSLSERYTLLLKGLGNILTMKVALAWLIGLIILNLILLKRMKEDTEARRIVYFSRWILLCSILYILLLPFGGYRSYREYIIRNDTFMPVTLAMVWLFGWSAYHLIASLASRWRFVYYFVIIYSLVFFTQFDKMPDDAYRCEREMLREIADSPHQVVRLSERCVVMDWQTITDPVNSSRQAELLLHWKVTKEKKLFYYSPQEP